MRPSNESMESPPLHITEDRSESVDVRASVPEHIRQPVEDRDALEAELIDLIRRNHHSVSDLKVLLAQTATASVPALPGTDEAVRRLPDNALRRRQPRSFRETKKARKRTRVVMTTSDMNAILEDLGDGLPGDGMAGAADGPAVTITTTPNSHQMDNLRDLIGHL